MSIMNEIEKIIKTKKYIYQRIVNFVYTIPNNFITKNQKKEKMVKIF